ncbi:myo-inosose-2 dehydratase, partial [Rhizobium ruizarguesonis]
FPNCPDFSEEQWKHLIEGLHAAGDKAKARNRRLCYHPHLGTGVMKTEAIHRLMDETDPGQRQRIDTGSRLVRGIEKHVD